MTFTAQGTITVTYITIEQIIATDGQVSYRWDGKHHPVLGDVFESRDGFIIGVVEDDRLVMIDRTRCKIRTDNLVEIARQIGLLEMA